MKIGCLLAVTVLISVSAGKAQSTGTGCPTEATCDTSNNQCLGYGDLTIKCANGTTLNFGSCFQSDICDSASANQGNDWIKITADKINPKQCHAYSQSIKQNLLAPYNTWCCQGNNFLKCCPNSIGWPSGVARSAANCIAMQDASTEVSYVAAAGSAKQTQFYLQLRPRSDSPLCRLLVYNSDASTVSRGGSNTASGAGSTVAPTGGTAATAAAATTAATANASTSTGVTTTITSTTTTSTSRPGNTSVANTTATSTATTLSSTSSINSSTTARAGGRRKRRADLAAHSLLRRSASVGIAITLDAATVKALITDLNVPSLVVTAVSTASNGSVLVTVTAVQNVASASNLTPDRLSYGWVVATGTFGGLFVAVLVTYLIACSILRSKSKGSRLPL